MHVTWLVIGHVAAGCVARQMTRWTHGAIVATTIAAIVVAVAAIVAAWDRVTQQTLANVCESECKTQR